MGREIIDGKLQQLRSAVERIKQNLTELETDPNRALLDTSTLTGESAARWSDASAKLNELWQWNGLLEAHVERAQRLRDGKRFDELEALLDGQSIELSISEVPLAQRTLLGDSQVADRISIGGLLRRMSAAFDEVKVVVAGIGAAWDDLIPRVDAARKQLTECQQLAAGVGDTGGTELESAARQLAALSAQTTSDPLAVKGSDIDQLMRSLTSIRADLASIGQVKGEFDRRLAAARASLERLRGLVEEGRTAHEELLVKIAQPNAPAVLDVRDDLDGQLVRISTLATSGAWRDARRELEAWTVRTDALVQDAERILAANCAPIESRNQYRALLDAYQVKAKALDMIEDPVLATIYSQVHDALYAAPTDLALVGQLMRRYQETLNGTAAMDEGTR
jgi:chromosome segregation ATPase